MRVCRGMATRKMPRKRAKKRDVDNGIVTLCSKAKSGSGLFFTESSKDNHERHCLKCVSLAGRSRILARARSSTGRPVISAREIERLRAEKERGNK